MHFEKKRSILKPIYFICTGYSSVSYTVQIGFDTLKTFKRTCTMSKYYFVASENLSQDLRSTYFLFWRF